MTKVRSRGEQIRSFILSKVEKHPADIAKVTAGQFDITRQAVNKHLQKLVDEKSLIRSGKTKNQTHRLASHILWEASYGLTVSLEEDVVWRTDIAKSLGPLPENVLDIWHYGFTEMFNNAIDHSEGTTVNVALSKSATNTMVALIDNGIGIFNKIKTRLGLEDERHAILELAKGKLTTDPDNHTGEGIFFTSRMFDDFVIFSGATCFSHRFGEVEDWINEQENLQGTAVYMRLNNHTARTLKKVFDLYSTTEEYGFTKTVVPVKLGQYGQDRLVSRSQAKRLLARVDRFKTVIFDFKGVDSIGQAFADEVFRVFPLKHPEMDLVEANTKAEVQRMIDRARSIRVNLEDAHSGN